MATDIYVGKTFGNYYILNKSTIKQKDNNRRTLWKCRCNVCFKIKNLPPYRFTKSNKTNKCYCKLGKYSLTNRLFNYIKKRCRERGYECNITEEYLEDLFYIQKQKCALSGIRITIGNRYKGETTTASVDRIDSDKGYVKNNIQWVHKTLNGMKSNLTQEAFIKWCCAVANNKENKE